jgi:ribosomal-protein-alanine N-acetyltransferase
MTLHTDGGWAIRRAVEAELAQVVLLERETETAPHWAWADYGPLLQTEKSTGLRRCLFVAAEGRVVQGFAVGKALGTGQDVEAELESVVVRKDMRRQGLGSALCRTVVEWARGEGAGSINLEVRAGSAGALRLYGGLGFVAIGRRPAYYREPVEDAIVMRCMLASSGVRRANGSEEPQPALF